MTTEDRLPPEVAIAVERLDDLVQRFESHPDAGVQDQVIELLRCVDILHRAGLRRLAELLRAAGLIRRALDDPEARLLLELYELDNQPGERERIEAVLDSVRPAIETLGGRAQVVEPADSNVAGVRLTCPATSEATLRSLVESALRDALPDVPGVTVEVETLAGPESGSFVPLAHLVPPRLVWRSVGAMAELEAGQVRAAEIDGERMLLANLEGVVRAYRDACPGTPLPLRGGPIEAEVLICPWHRCRFDLRTGQRISGTGAGLEPVPVRVEAGDVCVGLREGAAA